MLVIGVAGAGLIYFATHSFTTALLAPGMFMGFSFVVWLVLHLVRKPLVFDKRLGIYWEGSQETARFIGDGSAKLAGRIADIYALQLVSTYRWVGTPGADTNHEPRNTYELNLVMKDGARRSIVRLDDFDSLKKDAKVLADFLEKDLWVRQ